jgi:hypothetical protein
MIQQIERCVAHQKAEVEGGPQFTGAPEEYQMGEFIAPEEMGNGQSSVECEQVAVWGLRPPGDDAAPIEHYTGDWA